jgi:uncharacterized protein (TIRG00374 family)
MKKKITLSFLLGFLLSAVGLYLAFRNVPVIDIMAYLADIRYIWILPSSGLVILGFVIRVIRWRIILGPTKKIGFWSAFHPLMISFTINCILPGRLGELARPAVLMKKEAVGYSTGLATVAVERAFDMGLVIAMFLAVYRFINIDPNIHISIGGTVLNRHTLETIVMGMVQIGVLLIIGMLLVSFQRSRTFFQQVILKIPALLFFTGERFRETVTRRICTPLVRLMDNFSMGFKLIRSPVKILACLGLSMSVWVLAALSYYLLALGCPGIEISLPEMAAVMVITCIFIALPSVPGYWGLWEAGGIFALSMFGVSQKEAAGFTLANHAVQMFPVIIIGFVSAFITGVNIWRPSVDTPGG